MIKIYKSECWALWYWGRDLRFWKVSLFKVFGVTSHFHETRPGAYWIGKLSSNEEYDRVCHIGQDYRNKSFTKDCQQIPHVSIMRQTACLVVNPIIVDGYASLFNCTTAVRASDPMTTSS